MPVGVHHLPQIRHEVEGTATDEDDIRPRRTHRLDHGRDLRDVARQGRGDGHHVRFDLLDEPHHIAGRKVGAQEVGVPPRQLEVVGDHPRADGVQLTGDGGGHHLLPP